MWRFFLPTLIFILSFGGSSSRASTVILDQTVEKVDVWPYIDLLIDETSSLSIDEVLLSKFSSNKKSTPSYPITPNVFWLRFNVINKSAFQDDWMFELDYPTLTDVQFYIFKGNELAKAEYTGIKNQSTSSFKYRNPVIATSFQQDEKYTVFIRIETNSSMQIPVYAFSYQGFFDEDVNERNLLWAMMGIILFSIVFNFTLSIVKKEQMYVFLGLALLFIEIHLYFLTGYINEVDHSISPDYVERIRNLGYTVAIVMVFLFAMLFLEVRKSNRILYIINLFMIGVFVIYAVLTASPFISFRTLNALSGVLYLIGIIILIVTSVYMMIKGHSTAKYFVVATSVFLLSGLIFNAYFSGLIGKSFVAQHSLIISCTVFAITLTIGLTENIASRKKELLRLENLKAQNELLEKEISVRTEIEEELRQHKENLQGLVDAKTRELLDSERSYSYIVENLQDWIWQVDKKGRFTYNSPGLENTLGYTPEELNGKSYSFLFPEYRIKSIKALLEQEDPTTTGLSDLKITCFTKQKEVAHLEVRCVIIFGSKGGVKGLRGIARDVTEKVNLERKVIKAVLETEEKERNRFAIELHDGLGATLSGINMYLNTIVSGDLDDDMKQDLIHKSHELIKQAAASTREIASDIRPYVLNEFGLVVSIESLSERFSATNELVIDLKTSKFAIEISKDVELILFRVISEMINNTIKHANADSIFINLFNEDNKIFLIYQDNGVGFVYEEYLDDDSNGMGIQNILTRIKSLGGKIEFSAATGGKGFKTYIEFEV